MSKNNTTFLILTSLLFYGCATPVFNYSPNITDISEPPIGNIQTASVGDELLKQGKFAESDAIFVEKDISIGFGVYVIGRGYYTKVGENSDFDFYLPAEGNDGGEIRKGALSDPWRAIQLSKAGNTICVITVFNLTSCGDSPAAKRTKHFVLGHDSFQQTLIYSGKVGEKINIGYREFSNNIARPAFNNNVEYDLSTSKTIGYKGAKLEIIEATNENIKYRVISNFNIQQ